MATIKKYTFEIYLDKQKQYRWRLYARNGRIVADSAEGYKNRQGLMKTLSKLASNFLGTVVIIDTTK